MTLHLHIGLYCLKAACVRLCAVECARVFVCWGEKHGGSFPSYLPTLTPSPSPFLRADGKITLSAPTLPLTFREAPLSHFLPPSHCFPCPGPPNTGSSCTSRSPAGLSHLVPSLPSWGHWNPRDLTLHPSQPLGPEEPSSPQSISSHKEALWNCGEISLPIC